MSKWKMGERKEQRRGKICGSGRMAEEDNGLESEINGKTTGKRKGAF